MLKESLKISLYSIRRKRLTSSLTILGIVIGIAAIVALVSIGASLENAISSQLEQFGADKVMVMASMVGGIPTTALMGESLNDDDISMIEDISGVSMAVGMLIKTMPIKYSDKTIYTYVAGLSAEESKKFFSEIQAFEFEKGRFFEKGEGRVAVIGTKLAHQLFEKDVRIGSYIEIKGVRFKVIGILKSTGDPQDDQSAIIPMEALRDFYGTEEVTMIFVKATSDSKVNTVAEKIEDKLDDKYGEDTYMAMTSEQLMERIGTIFSILSIFLAGIASIALIVAGVGITNTMFMSVMERTREIGIMKAIGATNTKILEIFLIESALLGLIGGAIGCMIGTMISFVISSVSVYFLSIALEMIIPPWLIGLGLGFSTVVGIIAGALPARRAAKLNPVDALRYE